MCSLHKSKRQLASYGHILSQSCHLNKILQLHYVTTIWNAHKKNNNGIYVKHCHRHMPQTLITAEVLGSPV